jgi:PAS domain S-box-containing protein
MRILLVEDNADHRELMRLSLTGHDPTWQIEEVASGEEALRRVSEKQAFDLVFLDYSLPKRDGLEVLEEILRGEASPPVVMVTGRGSEQVAVRAMKTGAYDYVVKGKGYLQQLPVIAQRAVDRKRAEEALRESEEKFRLSFENAVDAIFWADPETGLIINCNKRAEILLEKRKEQIIGLHQKTLHPPNKAGYYASMFRKHKENGYADDEAEVISKSGKIKPVHITASVTLVGGKPIIQGIFRDITERKRAEDKIKASLKEKEVLLKEIHHRVKNNLQVVSSLLSLQSGYVKDRQALEMFKESQNRVRSMALIHEKLYESKDLARIDIAGYIQDLTTSLFRSYGTSAAAIKLNIDVKDIFLNITTSIPCGLIINELVSNSLKHAFPDAREGEIKIAMQRINDNKIKLIVGDNGIGFPKDIDFRNTESLGMQVVITLAEQLDGTIELDKSSGTTFRIRFPS